MPTLWAPLKGGAAAVLLAATHPERVLGLILYASTPKILQTNHEPYWAGTKEGFTNMIERMQKSWGEPWAIESFAPSRAQDESFRNWWAKILRAASSPSSIKAVLDLISDIDIRALLPHVRTRTLVIHKTEDQLVNVEAGRYLASHIPNAEWVELPGADHIYFVASSGLIKAISQFVQQETPRDPADTWVAILLFAKTKDESNSKHIQTTITHHRPRHITRTPRGVVALFDSPTRAVNCALNLRQKTTTSDIRVSLHIGECYIQNGNPLESVLEIAQRAAEIAKPGEIVISRTLNDILAGSGFTFQPYNSVKEHPESFSLFSLI
ncbi:MAG: alpha/beta fold hydrolase [Anaerolineae bacterium]|nr:alpha/beta fold hydrolase [Anaerolineae bacterium]